MYIPSLIHSFTVKVTLCRRQFSRKLISWIVAYKATPTQKGGTVQPESVQESESQYCPARVSTAPARVSTAPARVSTAVGQESKSQYYPARVSTSVGQESERWYCPASVSTAAGQESESQYCPARVGRVGLRGQASMLSVYDQGGG
jgi:hypothetical protein